MIAGAALVLCLDRPQLFNLDLLARFHTPLTAVIDWDVSYAMAAAVEIISDSASRVFASYTGWDYPMSRTQIWVTRGWERVMNALRGEKEDPIIFEYPWHAKDPDAAERALIVGMDSEEKAWFEDTLKTFSAIPD